MGGNAAAGLGLVEKTANYMAVSAMTSATTTSVATAGALSYASFTLGTDALAKDMNFSDYLKNATII